MKKKTGLGVCLGFAWALAVSAAPTHLVDEKPVRISQPEPGVFLVDFGRDAHLLSTNARVTSQRYALLMIDTCQPVIGQRNSHSDICQWRYVNG